MSFFNLSTGAKAESNTSFEIQGGSSEPIPAGSILLVVITEAKWEEYEGEKSIKLRWDVVGNDYNKRVIFQKLKVTDLDPKKSDKAKMMLMAIDANAGKHLSKLEAAPTDDDLQKLTNRKMAIMVDVWELQDKVTGETKSGNWVKMVASAKEGGEKVKEMGGNPKPADKAPVKTEVQPELSEDDFPF